MKSCVVGGLVEKDQRGPREIRLEKLAEAAEASLRQVSFTVVSGPKGMQAGGKRLSSRPRDLAVKGREGLSTLSSSCSLHALAFAAQWPEGRFRFPLNAS